MILTIFSTGLKDLMDGPLEVAIPTTTFDDVKGNYEVPSF